MTSKPVYSTATGRAPKESTGKKVDAKPAAGPCKMRLETKGRGGKAVTVLFNLPFAPDEAQRLMKELQSSLGCGATYKDHTILFQGDRRDPIEAHFVKNAWKIVRAGG